MAEKKETKEVKETKAAKESKEKKETKKKSAPKKEEAKKKATPKKSEAEKKPAPKKEEAKKKTAPKKDEAEKKTKKTTATKETVTETKSTSAKVTEEVKAETAPAPNATLQKKRERREAKAARKAANLVEEKKSRPNNLLLGILIFGVLVGMFAFVAGYNYFSKPATIEKYIEKEGGAEVYGNMQVDEYTTANITAKGNSINIEMTADVEDEVAAGLLKDSYSGDDGKENLEDIAAYFLTSIKPNVRGFNADAAVKMTLNGEELNSVKMTYKEAKKKIKEAEEEAEEHNHDHEDEDAEAGAEEIEVDGEPVEIESDDAATETESE